MSRRVVLERALLSACAVLGFALVARCPAADGPNATPAMSPQESLQQIVVDPDLKVELVAHEPNVVDPVAIRFDEDGRMWVIEMRDYPTGPTKEFPAKSRISILRDQDGDGFFETATVFADNLSFATGLQPWKGGVFVTLAGKVVYMKDTDGDDKADVNETWYTGFAQTNEQLRANHPTLALDNHIYVAAGLRGGAVVDAQHPDAKPVSLSGMDFRFDPLTHNFEAVTGEAQFGLSFNDFGDRFVCSNRDPAIHVVLEDRDVKRNPLATISPISEHVVRGADATPIFPLGRAWTTSNLHAGQFTAACAVNIFRGDVLPAEYYGNIFTCEPTGYLVHRELVKPNGVTFRGEHVNRGKEFFASRDEWCRPVNLEVGPDGALYVVDMYRQIIEHPEWMPEELRHRPNLRAGNDRGRIYRVVVKDFKRTTAPKMSTMSNDELVALLTHKNSWRRETAARLLLERQDKSVGPMLRKMALKHESPVARVQALGLLDGLKLVDDSLLLALCEDANPRVVEQAILVSEARVEKSSTLRERIARLVNDKDARVRFNALLIAAPLPTPPKYMADEWEVNAMLIATGKQGGTVLAGMLADPTAIEANLGDPELFVARLARLAAALKDAKQSKLAIDALVRSAKYGRVGLTGFLSEALRGGGTLEKTLAGLDGETRHKLDGIFAAARADAMTVGKADVDRCEAIDLLAFSPDATSVLLPLAMKDADQGLRLRAIAALAKGTDAAPWNELLASFSHATPAQQRGVLDGIFLRPERIALLLDAIESGTIKPTVIDQVRSKSLLNSKDATTKSRAEKLLAAAVPADREKVLAEYRRALEVKADAARGRGIFEKRCAVCHKIGDVGIQFAPDISDSRERTPIQLLTDIVQPNRAIDSNYFSYTAITNDGRAHTGVLGAETSTSVTLRQQEGKSETLRRDEIEELHSDGVSYMPEGLEKDIPRQDMADLISFIKNWRYFGDSQQAPAAKP